MQTLTSGSGMLFSQRLFLMPFSAGISVFVIRSGIVTTILCATLSSPSRSTCKAAVQLPKQLSQLAARRHLRKRLSPLTHEGIEPAKKTQPSSQGLFRISLQLFRSSLSVHGRRAHE